MPKATKKKENLKVVAIIPSAGLGERLGFKKKPFITLSGTPLLAHTLTPFQECPLIDTIIVAVASEDIELCKKEIIEKYGFTKVSNVVSGGLTRQDSIKLALNHIKDGFSVVVVHDGARALVTGELITETIMAASELGAAITAVAPKDTIKQVAKRTIIKTIPRDTLVSVQTPQAFRTEILKEAYEKAAQDGFKATDDSSLVERLGRKVAVVAGSYENIKITTPEDLGLAESILRARAIQPSG